MAAALTTTHSMVAPHPAPAAAAQLFGADLGLSILYGIAVSVPMAIVGGILYGGWVSKRINIAVPAISEEAPKTNETQGPPPSLPVIVLLLLLPVLLIFGATLASFYKLPYGGAATFLGHPFSALTITALVAIYWLGLRRGVTRENAGKMAAQSLAPMGALLCIMGGGGAFKQIIVDSGVGQYDVVHFSALGCLGDRRSDADRARFGDGGDHYRGGNRGAHREGHSRLQSQPDYAGSVLRRIGVFARERLGLLAGEPVFRDDRGADPQIVDGDESHRVGCGAGNRAGHSGAGSITKVGKLQRACRKGQADQSLGRP
jgi:hypothetical protein